MTRKKRILIVSTCLMLCICSIFGSYKKASALVTEAVAAAFAYTLLSVGISYTASTLLQVPEAAQNDMNSYQHGMGDSIMAACINAASGGILHLNGAEWAFLKDWAKAKGSSGVLSSESDAWTSDLTAEAVLGSTGYPYNSNDLRTIRNEIQYGNIKYFSFAIRSNGDPYLIWSSYENGILNYSADNAYSGKFMLTCPTGHTVYRMFLNSSGYKSDSGTVAHDLNSVPILNNRISVNIDIGQKDRDVATAIDQNTYDLVTDGRTLTNIDDVNSLSGDVTLTIPQSVIDNVADTLSGVNAGTISIPQALAQVGAIPVDLATDKTIAGDMSISEAVDSVTPLDTDIPQFDIKDLFPFCIPFDIADMFGLFVASPVIPSFDITIPYGYGRSASFTGDLSFMDSFASLARTVEVIGFSLFLAFKTRDLIRG